MFGQDALATDDRRRPVSLMRAPFTWFGCKTRIADQVWTYLGPDVRHYIEPFFGSGAVLLARNSTRIGLETINDANGYVVNFWRAVQSDPESVIRYMDYPVFESDLHARNVYLTGNMSDFTLRLEGDPEFYDPKLAGWWCWGQSMSIGSSWVTGNGPWKSVGGLMTKTDGTGGIRRAIPSISGACGPSREKIQSIEVLSRRLRDVRVMCGDWSRVVTPCVMGNGTVGVLLDPPYDSERCDVYACETYEVSQLVRNWCLEHGSNPNIRIVLCGYAGEHDILESHGWRVHEWSACGYGAGRGGPGDENRHKERLWVSPHCLQKVGFF